MPPKNFKGLSEDVKGMKIPEELLESYKLTRRRFGDTIYFYAPGMVHYDTEDFQATNIWRFPGVSITGNACNLNCDHCGGKLLETMLPATSPSALYNLGKKVAQEGGKGMLVSGGSQSDGTVPLHNFIPIFAQLKRDFDLTIVVHTGIVDSKTAESLATVGVDSALIDLIGSDETIKKVYHLDRKVTDLETSLISLKEAGIPTVPHIVLGLHYGRILGEKRAIQIASRLRCNAIIFVVMTPKIGTVMEKVTPCSPWEVAKLISFARQEMPEVPLILGCSRPGGYHRDTTDMLSLSAGVSGIAYPSEKGVKFAQNHGLKVRWSHNCCSILYRDILREKSD